MQPTTQNMLLSMHCRSCASFHTIIKYTSLMSASKLTTVGERDSGVVGGLVGEMVGGLVGGRVVGGFVGAFSRD